MITFAAISLSVVLLQGLWSLHEDSIDALSRSHTESLRSVQS